MKKCIVCDNGQFRLIYSGTLKKCTKCGFITANMEISEEVLRATYSIRYFTGEEYMDYQQDKKIIQLNFLKRLKEMENILKNDKSPSNCLEIGCAYGFFGEVLLKRWKTDYKGIDVVPEAINYGRECLGLDLLCGDYLRIPAPEISYSDVFMWDVIEHLEKPQDILNKISKETQPGSRIYITTGDISALLPGIQKNKWRMIHPPSHLHYFSYSTLTELLKKYGFSVIFKKYLPVYRSIRQIFYSLFLLKRKSRFMQKLINIIPERWTLPLNTFDIVFIIAEKNQ